MLALVVGLFLIFAQFYGTPTASLQSVEELHPLQYNDVGGPLELTVAFSSASYSEAEGTRTVYATVTVVPAPDREVTVNVSVAGSGATLPDHPNGSVVIACGDTSAQVGVQFQDDSGSVTLVLSLPQGTQKVTLGSPSSSVVSVGNPPPFFPPNTPTELSVPENSGAGEAVGVVAASDPGDTLSYRLSGEGSDKFEVDDTGRITVKPAAALDYESKASYAVTVTATDSADQSAAVNLTIRIADVDEPPPPVASMSITRNADNPTSALDVSWLAPVVPSGVPAITGYQLQYRERGKTDWNTHTQGEAVTRTTIGDLLFGTVYEVRVRTMNDEGESVWSLSDSKTDMTELVVAFGSDSYIGSAGSRTVATKVTVSPRADRTVRVNIEVVGEGAVLPRHPNGRAVIRRTTGLVTVPVEFQSDTGSVTLKLSLPAEAERVTLGSPASAVVSIGDNPPPAFRSDTLTEFAVAENSGAGQSVGVVKAADPGDTLTYHLSGEGSDKFNIDDSGLIEVGTDANLDYESRNRYLVTVTARDSANQKTSIDVTVSISDVDEPPPVPESLSVTPDAAEGHTTLKVEWTAPSIPAGVPEITEYRVRYRTQGAAGWKVHPVTGQGTMTFIRDLSSNTAYEVQVRAVNHEGESDWASARGVTDSTAQAVGDDNSQGPTTTGQSGGAPVTVNGANAVPSFVDGSSTVRRIDENLPTGSLVGQPVKAVDSDPDDEVNYILAGEDFTYFDIDEKSGQIVVAETLDFEKKASYSVRVIARDRLRGTDTIEVTIEVTNVDEAGLTILTVEETSPEGTITATLKDPDGDVSNVKWKWQSSTGDRTAGWTDIPGAASASYTPTYGMLNKLVRAVASYTDAHGAGKRIEDDESVAVLVERAQAPSPTPTPAPSPAPPPTPTPSAKPTASPTTAAASTPIPTPTHTPSNVPTVTRVPTVPQTVVATPVSPVSPAPTISVVTRPTSLPTAVPVPTATPSPIPSAIPTPDDITPSQPETAVAQPMDANGGGVPTWAYFLALGVISGVVLGVAIGWLAARAARR